MGSDPFLVLSSRGEEITISRSDGSREKLRGNPFDTVDDLLKRYSLDTPENSIPFVGGAVGYFSYDLCHFIERLPKTAVDDLQLPECYLAFYDSVVAFNHLTGQTYLVATGFPELEEAKRRRRAEEKLEEMKDRLLNKPQLDSIEELLTPATTPADIVLKSNFTREEYLKVLETTIEYIRAGDIFQANISQRFEAYLPVSPYELYQQLRRINPAPFANYFNFDEVTVVGASPERFLKVSGDWVQTRPIKGTRPRGKTPAEDEALAQELLASEKDRAENIMIVDLERNDLGRICRYGTVKVTEMAILETYPTVFHLTSTVEGRLRPGKNRVDLLKATFPGGSITGAPKVRAMEIIDELEPTRRSVYTGSLGYLSFTEEMDIDIVIRTMIIKDGRAYFQVGGGIVYDSEPAAEYEETLDKARALIQALTMSAQVILEAKS